MAEVSSQTLHIVARELASELNEARASLEAFGEQQDNLALLRKCNEHLHSVHGALRVAEVYGAALLAEEMGQVAQYLIGNFNEKRHLAEGLDALMRAMVQLPTYLERVMSGGRDMALVLLPLLNDLRAVRGNALLSEGTLLLLNLSSDQQANPAAGPGEGALTVAQWSRKLRTRFQIGLLGWIKGERVDQNLEVLSRTAEKLEHVATTQGVFQLWWVVGAVLEALREGGLESSASIKRLLGQADRDMKRLYELGEARYSDSPPLELLNNLLYYVARARTNGPRVAAVRASFRLSELLPVDDGVEQARESLSAPSVKLMKTVAAAIKEDLSRVKDALDIFVRQGGTQVDELAPQLELLKKIADTLGVLGLGELRDKVQSETTDLQSIVAQKSKASESTLLRMAATLIKVEDSLDEQLVGMIVPTQSESGVAPKPAGPDEIEFRLVTEAVLRECIVNMARIKEAIAHSVEKPREAPAIDQIPQLMRGITAGLLMLGKTRVVEIMEGIDRALAQFVRSDGLTLPQEAVDRLADAIVAVEYYMETIQAGRTDPWYMLDNAETCLRFLAEAQPIPRMEAYGGTTSDHARTVVIEPTAQTIALHTEHEPTAILDPVTNEVRRPAKQASAPPPPALTKPVDREVDPEFVELFIEEAKDEIAKLNQFFPLWDANPQDAEALINVRRSFHTLKGSGRMVGAQLIGDFAWSVENLLNRIINKTLDRTPDIMTLLRSSVAVVPELVEQLETGRAPQADIARIINAANTMAGVRPGGTQSASQVTPVVRRAPEPPVLTTPAAPRTAAAAPPPEKKTAPAVVTPPRDPEPQMDPGLHEIYAKETAGHLAAIRKFIAGCQLANAPYPVTEDLHRSCHTLSGTAKTAGARQGIKIAEPLNRYVRKLYDNSIGISQPGLDALRDAVTAIQQVVDHITESTGFFLDHGLIVKRLGDLEHELDLDISRLAEALETTSANSSTAGDATGEHPIEHTAATSVNLELPPEAIEIEEISLSSDDVLEGDVLADGLLEPETAELNALEAKASTDVPELTVPEEITLDSTESELAAGSESEFGEEIILDSTDLPGEEITLDSTAPEVEEITLDSTAPEVEEITLDSTAISSIGEPADEIIELESTDASALESMAWSYQNFPPDRAPAANEDSSSTQARLPTLTEELAAEGIILDGAPDEVVDASGIVVDEEPTYEGPGRSLLQMNEPLPDDASDIVIETTAWAAEFEPQVLPVDAPPATNRDDAETIRSPSLMAAEAELFAAPDVDSFAAPLDATRAVEVAPTLLPMDELAELSPPAAPQEIASHEIASVDVPVEATPTAASIEVAPIDAVPADAQSDAPSWSASVEVTPVASPAEVASVAAQLEAAPAAAPVLEAPYDDDYDDSDFDAEVAAIFTEEASELLETADQSLSAWVRDRANSALVFELKRVVHTLKGGAGMAGIRAMGDLSHELETLMGLVETGEVGAKQEVFDGLQASLDELHRMRDRVANGERCKPARELMNRIRALCGQEPKPIPAALRPVPEPVPEAVFDAPAEEVVEIIDYSPDDQDIGSQTDIVPTLNDIEALVVEETTEETPEVEAVSDVEEEFGADELGAVAPREAVRVEEPPTLAVNTASAATGVHAALDVATLAPELAPDAEQEEAVVEPQAPALPGRERQVPQERQEFARVDADLLDNLLNNAGEVSIFRSRMEQQVSSIEFNLAELGRTVTRLKEQLRKLEMETEAQILHRHQEEHPDRADFDPLELDRYSTIQQLSRAFAESVSDVSSIEGLLENLTREAQNLLLQQSRVVTEMQNGLMRTRMVPFQRHVQRLSRLVRQVASDTGKRADLVVVGASGELDRQVLERMLPPFEHMLRNSVVHGIETPEERASRGKSPQGTIKVGLHREGSEMVIVLEDDGRGIDVNAVRERAKSRGLLQPGRVLSDEEAMQLILEPGFSTASNITQHAGRGVGMDVVVNEIKKLGGALFTQSQPGQGVKFTIRLPFTLAITQALIVRTGDELYALPLPSVEGVARVPKADVQRHLAEENPTFNYGGQIYRLQHLGAFVGGGPSALPELDVSVPLILIRAGDHSTAIVTDELVGSREMVVKAVGPQIATIRGIAGATILGDGRIVIILDMNALVRSEWRGGRSGQLEVQGPKVDKRTFALVVDDSITVRRVTQRLLERNGMRVMTAKDGVDALSILQEHIPDVILLDIEMPRMDGYELATQVRADARLHDIPIVMITSRAGEKHRARAIEIGVNDYLGKPYQENQLLDAIEPLVQARRRKVS